MLSNQNPDLFLMQHKGDDHGWYTEKPLFENNTKKFNLKWDSEMHFTVHGNSIRIWTKKLSQTMLHTQEV